MINFMEPSNLMFLQDCRIVFLSMWLPFSMKIGGILLVKILKRIQHEMDYRQRDIKIAGMKARLSTSPYLTPSSWDKGTTPLSSS